MLKIAVFAALGYSSSVLAVGFEPLPLTPTGSAYINCYNDGRTATSPHGNFGSYPIPGTELPSASGFNTCALLIANDLASPKTGYAYVTGSTRTIPSVTGGSTSIGQFIERIWRKPAATAPATATDMCIFGGRVSNLSNTDHDAGTAGTQYFEVNDIARGGFSNSGTVNVAFYIQATGTPSVVYRAGRTFTSVQHRSLQYDTLANKAVNGTGYADLPAIGGSSTLNINGVNTPINSTTPASAAAGQQTAAVNSNWIDFTIDAVYQDDDGATNTSSAMTYVEAPCDSTSASDINDLTKPTLTYVKTGAIRLRQTAQENTTFKEIIIDGYAPPGAVIP